MSIKRKYPVGIQSFESISQMGIFSKLNNLQNISMVAAFDALCGISEEELTTQMRPDLESLGEANGLSYEEQLADLKRMYDGYHFSRKKTDIYNPFSLVNVFKTQELNSYWFASGTSSAVIELLCQMPPIALKDIDGRRCPVTAFDLSIDSYQDPLPALYQSGYLTIKDYQPDRRMSEEPTAKGQSDLVLLMPKGIYVIEIKYDQSAEEALDQIDRKGYAGKYRLDGRPVTNVGISFSSEERNITEWKSIAK